MFKILFYAYIAISLSFLFRNKKYLLYAYIFSLPFMGLIIDIGLQIDLPKGVSFIMLFALILSLNKLPKKTLPIFYFLFYLAFITIVLSIFLPETANLFPPLRGKYRWIMQIFVWFLLFVPLIYSLYIKTTVEIKTLLNIFIISLIILTALGYVQYISYTFFNYDPFPIGILMDVERHGIGLLGYYDSFIFRMSSIGGEPKHLAYSLVIGLTVLLSYFMIKKEFFNKNIDIFIFLFLFIALLLTFSTQGYILLFLNLTVLLIYFRRIKIAFFLIVIIFLVGTIIYTYLGMSLSDIIYLRLFREKEDILLSTYIEDWNEAVLGFLKDHPRFLITGVGVGNIHLWAQDYIPDYAAHYMTGNVFVAKSGFLRILSETGLFGLFLFFYSYLKPFINFKKYILKANIHFLLISILIFLDFLLSADAPPYFIFAFIIVYMLYKNQKKEVLEGEL